VSRVFISYRRDDSRWVARALKNKLASAIGEDQIFMDIDSIDPGLDFVQVVEKTISQVDVVIAIVGPNFVTLEDEHGNCRIQNPNDLVRLEIATALARNIRVIPLIESGTTIPTEDQLPDDLKPLSRRNAVEIGENSFDHDVDRIVESLRRLWENEPTSDQPGPDRETGSEPDAVDTSAVDTPAVQHADHQAHQSAPAVATRRSADESSAPFESSSRGARRKWVIPLIVVAMLAVIGIIFPPRGMLDKFQTADSEPAKQASGAEGEATSSDRADADAEVDLPASPIEQPAEQPTEPNAAVEHPTEPNTAVEHPTPKTTSVEQPPPKVSVVERPPAPASPVEQPVRPVQVDGMVWIAAPGKLIEGYYMGMYEVTQEQFRQVMGKDTSNSKQSGGPVDSVKWQDAITFCSKLNEMEKFPPALGIGKPPQGFSLTLPTQAQWEIACRAGATAPLKEKELYKISVCYERNGKEWSGPQSVGSKEANAWGLYDMLGNVEEWCLDDQNAGHVARGGYYGSSNLDVSKRSDYPRTSTAPMVGFRLAAARSGAN
jgi:formylglycine-generating enzyme required for sulfatase activity